MANAFVIHAAPSMLHTCKFLLGCIDGLESDLEENDTDDIRECLQVYTQELRRVIRLAEGREK